MKWYYELDKLFHQLYLSDVPPHGTGGVVYGPFDNFIDAKQALIRMLLEDQELNHVRLVVEEE